MKLSWIELVFCSTDHLHELRTSELWVQWGRPVVKGDGNLNPMGGLVGKDLLEAVCECLGMGGPVGKDLLEAGWCWGRGSRGMRLLTVPSQLCICCKQQLGWAN